MKAEEVLANLIKIISQEIDHYQLLLEYSQKQAELIRGKNFKELEEILQKKESVFNKIDRLTVELSTYKEEAISLYKLDGRKWLAQIEESEVVDSNTKTVIKKLAVLLKKIQKVDQENQELMKKVRLEIGQNFSKLKKGIKVNNNYNKNVRVYSTFIDKRS